MRKVKFASIALLILGGGFFVCGSYVSQQADQKELGISQIEQSEQGRRRPLIGPIRKSISNQSAQTVQGKLNQAEQTVVASQVTARWLRGLGIVLILMGAGGLVFYFARKKKTS